MGLPSNPLPPCPGQASPWCLSLFYLRPRDSPYEGAECELLPTVSQFLFFVVEGRNMRTGDFAAPVCAFGVAAVLF